MALPLPSVTALQVFAGRREFNTTGGTIGLVAGVVLASTLGIRNGFGVAPFGAVGAALGGGDERAVKGSALGFLLGAIP